MVAEYSVGEDSSIASRERALERDVFPRPFAISSLPHRDITMQNVPGEGDFEHYQGIWRMQSLPNCSVNGGDATRLTYAVEMKPRGLLPVRLIEGRIASDLKANLLAIRAYVEGLNSSVILKNDGDDGDVDGEVNGDRPRALKAISVLQQNDVLNDVNATAVVEISSNDLVQEATTAIKVDEINDISSEISIAAIVNNQTNAIDAGEVDESQKNFSFFKFFTGIFKSNNNDEAPAGVVGDKINTATTSATSATSASTTTDSIQQDIAESVNDDKAKVNVIDLSTNDPEALRKEIISLRSRIAELEAELLRSKSFVDMIKGITTE